MEQVYVGGRSFYVVHPGGRVLLECFTLACGSCGPQGIGSPGHLKPFSLLVQTDLKAFTTSTAVTKYFSSAIRRYSFFGGFHAPTDAMESGHVQPQVFWSLTQLPWPKCGVIMGGCFERLPSGDGFFQLWMCGTGQAWKRGQAPEHPHLSSRPKRDIEALFYFLLI